MVSWNSTQCGTLQYSTVLYNLEQELFSTVLHHACHIHQSFCRSQIKSLIQQLHVAVQYCPCFSI